METFNLLPNKSWRSGNRLGRLYAWRCQSNNYSHGGVISHMERKGERVTQEHTVQTNDFSHGDCAARVRDMFK